MTGLAIGVSNMKSGERALLHVGWELGYGKEGSFSFPNVPPMADILYEVELIGFDETKEGKARGDMTVEERIGAADEERWMEIFSSSFDKVPFFNQAIAYMGDDFMFQLFGKYRDMAWLYWQRMKTMSRHYLDEEKLEQNLGKQMLPELRDHKHKQFSASAARMSAVESKALCCSEDFQKEIVVTSLSLPRGIVSRYQEHSGT
ncbi:Peptidyl-prolyl cis-trans isomerase FKBP42 [Vitis vinifera]|uniref:peptidylprolyl isomerase n=1 Tax=Vitis vinifera TaxID=29760 RepID=A0A438J1S6_VITVI|nr:Peptidyl-prolyl cis-trans isomerase FKBP42 [Vitis vinifera]